MNFKLTQYCMWLNIIKKNWELIKKSASYYILIISFFRCFYHGILVWAFNTPCLRQVTLNDLQKRKNSFICEKETIKSPWKKEKNDSLLQKWHCAAMLLLNAIIKLLTRYHITLKVTREFITSTAISCLALFSRQVC